MCTQVYMTRIKKRRKICFVLLYALNKQHAILKQVDAFVVLNSEEEFQFAISFVVKFTQHLILITDMPNTQ